ncbi:hypothetical protein BDP27DRAFT_1310993 [Rhodocollybia butyracea]|uniref:Uncharacterized protein n=1 Tax=Rhodocollybia butyracea TaxID=206335 RepID=A0A9P5UGB7_9AGAR|nr:hypothetical protein BDP27DRAFT_1310993 [Rhodocollybia butyracea]
MLLDFSMPLYIECMPDNLQSTGCSNRREVLTAPVRPSFFPSSKGVSRISTSISRVHKVLVYKARKYLL